MGKNPKQEEVANQLTGAEHAATDPSKQIESILPVDPTVSSDQTGHEISGSRWRWLYARSVWLPTLSWNFMLGRILRVRKWWHRIDDHVILGALPFWVDVKKLSKLGVTGVINTCEEYSGPLKSYQRAKIEQFHMPTVDFTHPKFDDVVKAVDFIERRAEKGESVYVHCKAGRGRSATVVMGWLMKHYGINPEKAQDTIKQIRSHINPGLADRRVVRRYYKEVVEPQLPAPAELPPDVPNPEQEDPE